MNTLQKTVLVWASFSLIACEGNPSFTEMKENFYAHKNAFRQMAVAACELGKTDTPLKYADGSYYYNPEKIAAEHRLDTLDNLLSEMGAYDLKYKANATGQCSLIVGFYSNVLGGDGVSYKYTYRKEQVVPYDEQRDTFENSVEIMKQQGQHSFDMPLENDWYFSFLIT